MAGKEQSRPAVFLCLAACYMTEPFRKSGLRFRILPFAYGLLLMQNSHLAVLRQATPQSLERVASWKPRHIPVTGSVYNVVACFAFGKKGNCCLFPCHLNHMGKDSGGGCRKASTWTARSAKLSVRSNVGLRDNGIVGCTGRNCHFF